MKSLVSVLVCAGAFLFVACTSQSNTEKKQVQTLLKEQVEKNDNLVRMQSSDAKDQISFRGKEYLSVVTRRPDETLPVVKHEEGGSYVDNRITLRLTCGAKQLVNKAFTKKDFSSLIEPAFMKHALLEGIVFDKTTPQGFVYAASVGYPDSDLYYPIRITISADGKITMAKADLLGDDLPESEDKE